MMKRFTLTLLLFYIFSSNIVAQSHEIRYDIKYVLEKEYYVIMKQMQGQGALYVFDLYRDVSEEHPDFSFVLCRSYDQFHHWWRSLPSEERNVDWSDEREFWNYVVRNWVIVPKPRFVHYQNGYLVGEGDKVYKLLEKNFW